MHIHSDMMIWQFTK